MGSCALQLRLVEVNRQADFGSAFRLVTSIPGSVGLIKYFFPWPLLDGDIFLEFSWMEQFSLTGSAGCGFG